jgi:outer membrane lipoprotein-sorting protein
MRTPLTRIVVVAVATVLAAGTLGCGILSKAKDLANTAKVLSDFSDRLGKASTLTYTGTYKVTDADSGDTITVTTVQQPPNVAFLSDKSRFIVTKDFLYICDTEGSTMTCSKSPNTSGTAGPQDDAYIAGVGGPGFVTPELAIGLIAAAALVPGASVSTSNKTIAGQSSLCAVATGLDAAASPGDTEAPKDFTVCVTDAGVLASFSGTSTNNKKASIELTNYSTTVDPAAFAPPPGATVTDTTTPSS